MAIYKLRLSLKFDKDKKKFEKAGNKLILKKIDTLLKELAIHPKTGTGKPEYLKYKKCWSRRIDEEHRLCYEIYDDVVVVLVLSAFGHYD